MSFEALAWASKLKVARPADKLILLAYADRHNDETGYAYPSIAWLVEFSSLDRKTVVASVERLVEAGHLSDTGKRTGATKQIKVYTVHVESIPKTEQFQNRNSTEKGGKQSQKRDTEPVRTLSTSEAKASSVVRTFAPKRVDVAKGFVTFWEAYPRKKSKDAAAKAFAKAMGRIGGEDPLATIMAGIERALPGWDDPQFIPYPASWLNAGGWDDEAPTPRTESRHERPRPANENTARDDRLGRMLAGAVAAADQPERLVLRGGR